MSYARSRDRRRLNGLHRQACGCRAADCAARRALGEAFDIGYELGSDDSTTVLRKAVRRHVDELLAAPETYES